jgi:hypothetical protein
LVQDDPALKRPEHQALRDALAERWQGPVFGEEAG